MPRGPYASQTLLGVHRQRRPWLEQRPGAAAERSHFFPAASHRVALASPGLSFDASSASALWPLVSLRQSRAHTIQPAPRSEPLAYTLSAVAPSLRVPFDPRVPVVS